MQQDIQAVRFHEYGDADKLVSDRIPRPQPSANEVLVKIHYAGVNPVDWKIRAGYLKDFMPVSLPFTPGIDFSGVIEEIGAGVENFAKGQAVFGMARGAYAEYAVASVTDIALKPDTVSWEEAAAVPVGGLTAWKAVEDAGVSAGQKVVIQGAAGGVGSIAVQFARMKGAKVTGTSSTTNVAFVKSLGAEQGVDYTGNSGAADIRGADVVIDTVGGTTLDQSYGLLKSGGMLVTVAGMISEEKTKEFGIRALSSGRGPGELLKPIADLLSNGSLRVEVGKIFPLAEAKAAHELSQIGHGRGRILLKVAG